MSEDTGHDVELAAIQAEAHALLERRRFAQARQVIVRGLARQPDHATLQYLGACVDHAQGANDKAMQSLQALLAREPGHFGARVLMADVHVALRQFADAESMLIDLLREYPESADLYAAYADVMLSTLNLDKALALAGEGLRHDPEHLGCLQVVAIGELIQGGSSGGSEHLERLLRHHPDRLQSLTTLVVALNERGDHRGALRLARELLRSQPDSAELVGLVRALHVQNHWSMLPLYPMQRWGWGGAIGVTLFGIFGLRLLEGRIPGLAFTTLSTVWLIYVIYSWVWPSLLRRML
jgi:tetratricopeptide (TPR) repeat protein